MEGPPPGPRGCPGTGLLVASCSGHWARPGTPIAGTFPLAGGGCCQAAGRRSGGSPRCLGVGGLTPEGIAWWLDGGGSGSGAAARWLVGSGGEALCHVVPAVPFLRVQKTQCVVSMFFIKMQPKQFVT